MSNIEALLSLMRTQPDTVEAQCECMTELKSSFATGGTKLCGLNGIQLMGRNK